MGQPTLAVASITLAMASITLAMASITLALRGLPGMGAQQAPKQGTSVAMLTRYRDEFEDGERKGSSGREAAFRDWLDQLLAIDPTDNPQRTSGKDLAETWGAELQADAARQSDLLRKPLSSLSHRAGGGGEVGDALVELKMAVERVDPGRFNFEPGWMIRLLGKVPGIGTPLERYATKYKSTRSVIDAILRSLEQSRDELARDIVTLTEDQRRMRETTQRLQNVVTTAMELDSGLEARCADPSLDAERRTYLAEDVLFPMRQRILDLQQQLAVHQQGVVACELIIRNNKELIRGVNRALQVTASALQVGATVALALETQKRTLEKLELTQKATNDLIAGTAQRLRTQGTEIHKRAAGTQLDVSTLRRAFADMQAAMEDLSRFRTDALPQMADSVREFDRLTREGEDAIRRMERLRQSEQRLKRTFRR